MIRDTCRTLLPILLASVMLATSAPANTILVDDDFGDGDFVGWTAYPGYDNGQFDASSGDLVMTTNDGSSPLIVTLDNFDTLRDVAVQTQVRLVGNANAVSVFARFNEAAGETYQGAMTPEGEAVLGWNNPEFHQISVFETPLRVTEQDIELRLEVEDNQLRLFAWPAGGPRPTEPAVTAVDARFASGTVGLLYHPIGLGSATFRYARVEQIPEPSGLLMCGLGLLGLVRTWRRQCGTYSKG
ncbi:MAG: PEP-CTERM sorting domain-containing protein [Planctomycetales bacterium]|nr:PEP-CTERM sorting domain-containing protein [Planctomycetales bacterium]